LKNDRTKELFDSYSDDIFNYALSLLKNYDDAKDAVQDVFVKFMSTQESFRGDCSYKTWLLVLTRNYCYQKNSRIKQSLRLENNSKINYENDLDARITLNDAIARLNKEESEIIYLREFAGHSYKEMAAILDTSIDNIKVKLFRVRRQLRKYLK